MKSGTPLERIGFVLLAAGLGLIQFTIQAETVLGLAAVIAIVLFAQDPGVPGFKGARMPGFFCGSIRAISVCTRRVRLKYGKAAANTTSLAG